LDSQDMAEVHQKACMASPHLKNHNWNCSPKKTFFKLHLIFLFKTIQELWMN
jgi:hypothetical protein